MRILVVEDHQDTLDVCRRMLEGLGHEVFQASNGKEGLKAAIANVPDLVLTDLSMPECDGFMGISAMRAISTLDRVPIIAMTVYPASYWREQAELAGCDDFIQKPFDLQQLEAVLSKYQRAA